MNPFRCIILVLLLSTLGTNARAERFDLHHETVLGTSLHLQIEADSHSTALRAESHVLDEIDRLSGIFSSYDSSSELIKLQSLPVGSSMRLSDELFQVLRDCDAWTRASSGAFNPAVEALSNRWKQAESEGQSLSPSVLAEISSQIAGPHWQLNSTTQEATRRSALPLSLNAFAKGVILDRVAESTMHTFTDVQGMMIDIGGDIRVVGKIVANVSIANPSRDAIGSPAITTLGLSESAIATSGRSERGFQVEGARHSHLINPRTGRPVTEVISSTVIAPHASTADVLATICSVLPIPESLKLVQSIPGAKCLLVSSAGVVLASANWPTDDSGAVSTNEPSINASNDVAAKEPPFLVEFEISKAENSGRYRRPYVAVWIEDKDGFPVKTLSLFLMQNQPGPRWYRDLRRWYADDQMRLLVDNSDVIDAVSKPTRNPGQYKVAWDGHDDAGKQLKDGEYTLLIEAAREHGSYQLIKQKFELGGKAFEETLKANKEISAASFKYKK